MPLQSAATVRKRYALWALLALLAGVGTIGSIELAGRILSSTALKDRLPGQAELFAGVRSAASAVLAQRADATVVFDSRLGWRPQPGVNNNVDHINAQGLRALRDFEARPPGAVTRVSVFGDSFVYGTEVATRQAWPTLLDENESTLEILNYGVPGYGPDQALLRFQAEAKDLAPDIAILAITTPSLTRILTVSSVFHSAQPYFLTKPRYLLGESGELELLANPVPTLQDVEHYLREPQAILGLGPYDHWYQPWMHDSRLYEASYTVRLATQAWSKVYTRYLDHDRPLAGPAGAGVFNEQSVGFRILTLIMERFRSDALSYGMKPLILLLPDGYSVAASRAGGDAILAPVLAYCEENEFAVLDATEAFLQQPPSAPTEDWFFGYFHYTEAGNALVADWVGDRLQGLE